MMEIPTREDFESLKEELAGIKALLKIGSFNLPSVVKVKDIAKAENLSSSQIYTKEKYLLPNFGRSEYPDGDSRWNIETYLKWREIPIRERKEMYLRHLETIRKTNLKKIENGKSNAPAIPR